MISLTTEPYASIAEADQYFDPENHLYADEWWASTVAGSKAKLTTPFALAAQNLVFTSLVEGFDTNLIHVSIEDNPFAPDVVISYDGGYKINVLIDEGVTTATAMKDILNANEEFAALLVATFPTGGDGSGFLEEMGSQYLSGGVDPDPMRLGTKAPALAFATRKINNLPFNGEPVSLTQANAFPRKFRKRGAVGDSDDCYVIQTTVPIEVQAACCEEALAIMKYGNTPRFHLQKEGVKSYAFGVQGLRESFNGMSKEGSMISGEAMNLLRPYMRRKYRMAK